MVTPCISFTTVMIVYMALGSAFAGEGLEWSTLYCWSLLGACACTVALQLIFFTPVVIKRMMHPLRLLLFGICLSSVLATMGVTMAWFPADMAGVWVSFTVSYLVTLAAATTAFAAKRRREGRALNKKLGKYRKTSC